MSSASPPGSGSRENFSSEQQRLEFWQALQSAAQGQGPACAQLAESLAALPHPASALTDVALHHAGTPPVREALQSHLQDAKWSQWLPLHLQEYAVIFPANPRFHQVIRTAYTESGWAQAHQQALGGSAAEGVRAAGALAAQLEAIAQEAATLLTHLPALRSRIKPSLHAIQAQALTRAEWALGNLRERKVLEVGPQAGGLLREMIGIGAQVLGVDLGPELDDPHIIRGDFLKTPLPAPFELIIATGVFEAASCARGEPESDPNNNSRHVLERFHALTAPGAVVVLENFMFPIPFTHEDARAAGFEVVVPRLPALNLNTGGRGCMLRHVP